MAKCYVYYIQRRIAPESFPTEGVVKVSNYLHPSPLEGIGEAWGAILYNRELTLQELCDYKLKYGGETEYEQN